MGQAIDQCGNTYTTTKATLLKNVSTINSKHGLNRTRTNEYKLTEISTID